MSDDSTRKVELFSRQPGKSTENLLRLIEQLEARVRALEEELNHRVLPELERQGQLAARSIRYTTRRVK